MPSYHLILCHPLFLLVRGLEMLRWGVPPQWAGTKPHAWGPKCEPKAGSPEEHRSRLDCLGAHRRRCQLPGVGAEVLEGCTESRVGPGEDEDGDLEEEGHAEPGNA